MSKFEKYGCDFPFAGDIAILDGPFNYDIRLVLED